MTDATHARLELALQQMRWRDLDLFLIAEFMIETNITYSEIVSLRTEGSRVIVAGRLDVFGWDGPRSTPLSARAWALLPNLRVPDWSDLADLRERWLVALAPFGLSLPFEQTIHLLTEARVNNMSCTDDDDEVPF